MMCGWVSVVVAAPPEGLDLTPDRVFENADPGEVVGRLSTQDSDEEEILTFSLVEGEGDDDNSHFLIKGDRVRTASSFDYEEASTRSIRVRVSDSKGSSYEEVINVVVEDLNENDISSLVRPNILLYIADDMGIGDCSAYLGRSLMPNSPRLKVTTNTPNLAALASDGLTFTDAHVASSGCTLSRYSLMTGRHGWRGRLKHGPTGGWSSGSLLDGERTIAEMMARGGYRTAFIGKWHLGILLAKKDGTPAKVSYSAGGWDQIHLGFEPDGSGYVNNVLDGPLHHGFDFFYGMIENYSPTAGGQLKAFIRNNAIQGVPVWREGGGFRGPVVSEWDQQRVGETYADVALRLLDETVDGQDDAKPFFTVIMPNANHAPHNPAPEITVGGITHKLRGESRRTNGGRAGYHVREDLVLENDIIVGALRKRLSELLDPRTGRPMIESTLFVFSSDNGVDRYNDVARAGLSDYKTSILEGGHRVPFIASWPDSGMPRGGLSRVCFGLQDMFATLAEFARIPLERGEAGDSHSMAEALLRVKPDEEIVRPTPLVTHDDSFPPPWLPDVPDLVPGGAALAIRAGAKVLIADDSLVNHSHKKEPGIGAVSPVLYHDLDHDLGQTENLVDSLEHEMEIDLLAQKLLRIHNRGYTRQMSAPLKGTARTLFEDDGSIGLTNAIDGAVGFEFRVGPEIYWVDQLGMWDDAAEDKAGGDAPTFGTPDGVVSEHIIRLFDAVSKEEIADVTARPGEGRLAGEFRMFDLEKSVILSPGVSYVITMSTTVGDGDLLHDFKGMWGMPALPSGGIVIEKAVFSDRDGDFPDDFHIDLEETHEDSLRYRAFVGPTLFISPLIAKNTLEVSSDHNEILLKVVGGRGLKCEFQYSIDLIGWEPVGGEILGKEGTAVLKLPFGLRSNGYYRARFSENETF